jgi:hypothetical protein
MMATDAQRVAWIAEHINYMEHNWDKVYGKYNFWPHEEDENLLYSEKHVGMSLIEYIDSRIEENK